MPDAKRYLGYRIEPIPASSPLGSPPPGAPPGWIGTLADRFTTRRARVAVIGLGYAGLPMALALADAGFATIGLDHDATKLARLAAGDSGMRHVGSAELGAALRTQGFAVTGEWARLAAADAVLICVPTPLGPDRQPDLSAVEAAARSLAWQLRPGQLVVLGIHHLARHHAGGGAADPGIDRAALRRGLLPGLFAGAGGPGQHRFPHRRHPPRGRRRRRQCAAPGGDALWRGGAAGRAGRLAGSRRGGEADREHLPRRQHRPGERAEAGLRRHGHRHLGGDRRRQTSPSATCPSTRGPASAGTASRSTPSTWPGRRGRRACRRASSSWRARSTPPCPSTC